MHLEVLIEHWYYVLPFLILIFPIWLVVYYFRTRKERKEEVERLEEQEEIVSADEPPVEEIHGRVVGKRCYAETTNGTKSFRSYTCFYIDFLTDDGRSVTYQTDEELYLSVEEDAAGTVAIVGDRFYGFCPDEQG